jgi:preprotein translocase subunit SecD
MRTIIAFAGAVLLALSLFLLQAQAQFTIRAASDQPVPGWDRLEYLNHALWVSPIISLTSADIQRAEETTDTNGHRAVGVIFNDAGAKKISDLSTAQLNHLVAMILDGRVIFAPKVRRPMSQEALITGPASSGLSTEIVQLIVDSVTKK